MALHSKESNSGPVSWLFNYEADTGDVLLYCLNRAFNNSTSGLLTVSLLTEGGADASSVSKLTAAIMLDGVVVSQNNTQVSYGSGGFSTSATGTETIAAGSRSLKICVGGRNLSGFWNVRYSISNLI